MLEDGPFSGLEPPPKKRKHSSASSPRLYPVFINHRGSDVKKTVALPLYKSLRRMGFQVFLDSEEIQLGDYFPSALQNAILSASVHVAIFSKGYAKSPWCLAELVLMLETDAKIIPVFSGVRPSDLRYSQKGVYSDAFVGYQRKGRHLGKLEKWKEALHTVSFINGYEFSENNHDVDDMCEKIVSAVLKELDNTKSLNVAKHAVGLERAKTAFTTKKDFGKEEREAQWAHAQRTLHGIHSSETNLLDKISYQELSEISEEAKRSSQFARLTELHTLKGHVEAVLKLKGLDIETIQQAYSV